MLRWTGSVSGIDVERYPLLTLGGKMIGGGGRSSSETSNG